MERKAPEAEPIGADIPERTLEVLDPRSIQQSDIDADDYDESMPISEYLRNKKRGRGDPPGQSS